MPTSPRGQAVPASFAMANLGLALSRSPVEAAWVIKGCGQVTRHVLRLCVDRGTAPLLWEGTGVGVLSVYASELGG